MAAEVIPSQMSKVSGIIKINGCRGDSIPDVKGQWYYQVLSKVNGIIRICTTIWRDYNHNKQKGDPRCSQNTTEELTVLNILQIHRSSPIIECKQSES